MLLDCTFRTLDSRGHCVRTWTGPKGRGRGGWARGKGDGSAIKGRFQGCSVLRCDTHRRHHNWFMSFDCPALLSLRVRSVTWFVVLPLPERGQGWCYISSVC